MVSLPAQNNITEKYNMDSSVIANELHDIFTDWEYEELMKSLSIILVLKKLGYPAGSEKVQEQVGNLHAGLSGTLSGSMLAFDIFADMFEPGMPFAGETDSFFGDSISDYFYEAGNIYFTGNVHANPVDIIIKQSFENIAILGSSCFSADSPEVQQEAERIYDFCTEMKFIPKQYRMQMLMNISADFDAELKDKFEDGFISRAVGICCADKDQSDNYQAE